MSKQNSGDQRKKYKQGKLIGKGSFGCVYQYKVEGSNQVVAMKSIRKQQDNEGFPSSILREISLLKEASHQNIIKLKEIIIQQQRVYLVTQYMKCDLKQYIDNQQIDSRTMKKIMKGILSGLVKCHSKNIIHRDLKTTNILIDQSANVKIADFGSARTVSVTNPPYSEQVSTLWYRAPEILLGSFSYCKPVDIWGLGCVFAEMAIKDPPFKGNTDLDQLDQIFTILGTPNESIWPGYTKLKKINARMPVYQPLPLKKLIKDRLDADGLDLLQKMLKYDPNERITAEQALLHPYISQ